MNEVIFQAAVAAWAARKLPARIDVKTTAELLGFAEHDIQILMRASRVVPLGDPAPNAPKWFSVVEILQLAMDRQWLHKSSREVRCYWRHKRHRNVKQRAIRPVALEQGSAV